MLSWLLPEMSPALKRYYRRSALPCLAFVALVLARASLLDAAPDTVPWRVVLALLPLLAWFWTLAEYARFVRECDELERRIEFGAMVAGIGVSVTAAMALLFLLDARALHVGAERVAALAAVVPLVVFSLARHLLHRRYR